ncbi:Molybdopterin synthase sulfur carrier subunit [Amphibalanus amphitrite]|uniref:Molybdopterin synthase sulfur carrier subunit n=1 Tax=Amphibalanus amphitrite TaxID=1232801 RepID=A0A6A4VB44_AMPAM|nr:Molybdopterin synthase sulfur carrier subunit [Amphibalanus amphitrite]
MPAAADVTLLLFAKARELVGSPQVSVSVPTECSGAELRELLVQTYPQLATLQGTFILAVNQRYLEADESVTIRRGDEVAVIPPISGADPNRDLGRSGHRSRAADAAVDP